MSNGLWITPEELGEDYEDMEYAQEACEAASFLLWALSGRKFSGTYSITERYLLAERSPENRYYLAAGVGYGLPTSIFVVRADDIAHNKIRLRGKPVQSVTSVHAVSTGEEIDPETYNLWDHAIIRFITPLTGDVDVEYQYGSSIPTMGKMAARHLAIQFGLMWSGREDECSLPERVTNVTRQQVSWTILDSQDFIQELRTGVYTVDLFLKSVNPDKARVKAKVFSVDIPRGKRKTEY